MFPQYETPHTSGPEQEKERLRRTFLMELRTAKGAHGRFWVRFYNNTTIKNRIVYMFWWFVHNIPAHLAIGLLPIKASFKFHDWTSDKLNSPK